MMSKLPNLGLGLLEANLLHDPPALQQRPCLLMDVNMLAIAVQLVGLDITQPGLVCLAKRIGRADKSG